ncbi:prephenate dehydrogenase [Alicyclobacillus kakegawensis]|uniref:prephenate dehydrogenase n=1 Tax=Alicyclobacillus kakegawensis TaxID=392012 RepID=UPI00146FF5D4|nr:prephenate dehydrogenase/arogenate dehydrogenase family protein [Alicyclobacillus kakegawensis]
METGGRPARWPVSLLIVGCGLIGASLAMAWRQLHPDARIVGVDTNAQHQEQARELACSAAGREGHLARETTGCATRLVFDDVLPSVPNESFDVGVLAVPVEAACRLLATVGERAECVMDVCSVKEPVVEAAQRLGITERFAPTHPMAGAASSGPTAARPDLFDGEAWLVMRGWPALARIEPMLAAMGANIVEVPSAVEHDRAMAAVSHGVHLASLAVMAAYGQAVVDNGANPRLWSRLTGPGFRDVTRLAASPPTFWVSTLLSNRTAVLAHLERISEALREFTAALTDADPERLTGLLKSAQAQHEHWHHWRRNTQE